MRIHLFASFLFATAGCGSSGEDCRDWRKKDQPSITSCSSFETNSGSFSFDCDGIVEAEYSTSGSSGSGDFYILCSGGCLLSVRINGARVESVDPRDGEAEVEADACVVAELTKKASCPQVDLTGPDGELTGELTVRGTSLSFCPDGGLTLGETYDADVITDGFVESVQFGTYGLGSPTTGTPLGDGLYLGDTTSHAVLRLLGVETSQDFAIEFSGDASGLGLHFGLLEDGEVRDCTATALLDAGWDNPVVTAELSEIAWPLPLLGMAEAGAPIQDLRFEATLHPSLEWISMDIAFGADLRDAVAEEHVAALCDEADSLGASCQPCDDGELACLDLDLQGITMQYEQGGKLEPVDVSEVAADPECCGELEALWAYEDLDGDGYGDQDSYARVCELGEGLLEIAGDCDDEDAAVNPDAVEVCNEVDDDCDGTVDGREVCGLEGEWGIGYADHVMRGLDEDGGFGQRVAFADLDADGQLDMLVSDPELDGGYAYLCMGPITDAGQPSDCAMTLSGSSLLGSGAGSSLDIVDLNGDSHLDLIIGAPGQGRGGEVYIQQGDGAAWGGELALVYADITIVSQQSSAELGCVVENAGDLDGDGGSELVVGASDMGQHRTEGRFYAFSGSTLGTEQSEDAARWSWYGDRNLASGTAPVLGDIDLEGDGLDDLLMAGGCEVYVQLGASLPSSGSLSVEDADTYVVADCLGDVLANMGDLDGDGHEDIGMSDSYSGGRMYVNWGGHPQGWTSAYAAFTGSSEEYDELGSAFSGGDVDGDGSPDVFVSDGKAGDDPDGAAYLFLGPFETGVYRASDAWCTITGGQRSFLGRDVAALADVDGDGRDDLVVNGGINDEGELRFFLTGASAW
jgi:hypothetical protein